MSKRHLLKLVQDGHVEGWDDPRMPTISWNSSSWLYCQRMRDFTSILILKRTPLLITPF